MKTFKQWHDQEKFFNETQLYFCQTDMNHRMTLAELLRKTTDTAVEDYNQRGLPWVFLEANNTGILVSRVSFRIHNMPEANDEILITTWEEAPEPLQLSRSYEITTPQGEPLITGDSRWILVDLEKRRIMRTSDFTLRKIPEIKTEHDCMTPGKIIIPENLQTLGEHTIRFSDIDGNGHTDNARYAEFVMDFLPENYQQKQFSDFRMNYSKEAVFGDTISIAGNFDDAAKKITVVGKKAEETCFECELFWK